MSSTPKSEQETFEAALKLFDGKRVVPAITPDEHASAIEQAKADERAAIVDYMCEQARKWAGLSNASMRAGKEELAGVQAKLAAGWSDHADAIQSGAHRKQESGE